ncbi:MAG: KUP/HAK/KT family potassium transporter [Actinobacteria bacterium]|nr:KUP/HAK/KT family potassium transporter [Actinomycetota bacterium]
MLALAALGVVFGDIGTSPLYALQAAFSKDTHVAVTHANILGLLSLFFWALVLVVTVKYVLVVMRAGYHGEGGIMALMALASRRAAGWERGIVLALGLAGVALFYGDGVITPAISVLSAVEGAKVKAPGIHSFVLPIALLVLTVLFLVQRRGSGGIGRSFGPVMLLWFVLIGVLGGRAVVRDPSVLRAFDPLEAVWYFGRHPWVAFVSLGAVVLCITGVEALYADMGHFGRRPISAAWLCIVLPSLVLCYFGQGAIVLRDPAAAANPFFHLTGSDLTLGLVGIATVATVIASQAVISGVFSLTEQAVGLGMLPRLRIRHTSAEQRGQVYLPAANWLLYAAIVGVVVGFGSSAALAAAYGIAVTGTMTTTSVLLYVVARRRWRWNTAQTVLLVAPLLAIDLLFFAANALKVEHGGWFPLLLGALLFSLMLTWHRGQHIITVKRRAEEGELRTFVRELPNEPNLQLVPGTAVYPHGSATTTPLALRINVEHNHIRHERIIVLHARTLRAPFAPEDERVVVDALGDANDGIVLVTALFGYREQPNLPAALQLATQLTDELDGLNDPTYFLSRIFIQPTRSGGMALWRKRLFSTLTRNASSPAEYFGLPDDQVVAIGTTIRV